MQTDHHELYRLTAERTGNSEQVYKDIGNMVFGKLYSLFRSPETLITKLKGVGTWYLRRSRMKVKLEMYPLDPNKEFTTKDGFLKHEDKKRIYQLFSDRLKEYDEYIKLRDETRKKRHETQTLLESTIRKDQSD